MFLQFRLHKNVISAWFKAVDYTTDIMFINDKQKM